MQIQISWLLKPTDLDLHCLHRQYISGFSRTRVKQNSQGSKSFPLRAVPMIKEEIFYVKLIDFYCKYFLYAYAYWELHLFIMHNEHYACVCIMIKIFVLLFLLKIMGHIMRKCTQWRHKTACRIWSVFIVSMKKQYPWLSKMYPGKILTSANARRVPMSEGMFSDIMAHIYGGSLIAFPTLRTNSADDKLVIFLL